MVIFTLKYNRVCKGNKITLNFFFTDKSDSVGRGPLCKGLENV